MTNHLIGDVTKTGWRCDQNMKRAINKNHNKNPWRTNNKIFQLDTDLIFLYNHSIKKKLLTQNISQSMKTPNIKVDDLGCWIKLKTKLAPFPMLLKPRDYTNLTI